MNDKILVVGSINMDISLHVDHIPVIGETILAQNRIDNPGGKGANQAVAAAKLNGNVSIIGCVGKGADGDQLVENLKKYGVDCKGIIRSDNSHSGHAFISVSNAGENSIIVNSGANSEISKEIIDRSFEFFTKADYCILQLEIPIEAVNRAIRHCHDNEVKIYLNYSPAQSLENIDIMNIECLVVNESELAFCIGKEFRNITQDDIALFRKKYLIKTILLTLGKNGVRFIDEQGMQHYPATDDIAVDSTGAGDSFLGAYVTGISKMELNVSDAIMFAQKCAGITVTRYGAQNAMPLYEEVMQDHAASM